MLHNINTIYYILHCILHYSHDYQCSLLYSTLLFYAYYTFYTIQLYYTILPAHLVEDGGHRSLEAEVEEPVRLVEHEHLEVRELEPWHWL